MSLGHDEPLEQKEFFEHAGPLFSVRISPASCVVPVRKPKNMRAIARDRSRRQLEADVAFVSVVEADDTEIKKE